VLAALTRRGSRRVFVEGGGRTVSAFFEAGVLDRLQICVAPLLIGSGVPAMTLPPVAALGDAVRLDGRWLPMGRDMLFDCVLRQDGAAGTADADDGRRDCPDPVRA
ncbi:MAG: dihydrofolate reductase family protein, partial [Caenispirillum sp.]|nr:dihydrofolate reductase family protein [Caenispirillum sp.]